MNIDTAISNEFPEITTLTPDEDSEVPRRKPIGWNYQNVFPSKNVKKINGSCNNGSSTSFDSISERISKRVSDEIEILEVKKTERKLQPKTIFPPSSTRKEIKDTFRGTVQSSITKYLKPSSTYDCSLPSTSCSNVDISVKNEIKPHKSNERDLQTQKKSVENIKPQNSIDENTKSHKNSEEKTQHQINAKEDTHNQLNEEPQQSLDENNPSVENDGNVENKENIIQEPEITSEYSISIIHKFIEKWKTIKSFGKDDEKVKERLLKHYNTCHTSYTHSRKFINGLKKGTKYLAEDNLVKFISSIIDTLKRYKDDPYLEKKKKLKTNKSTDNEKEEENEEKKEEEEEEEQNVPDEAEVKKRRKLAKIEAAMIKVSAKIQKLECEEVDLEDDDNSSYLILDRLKQQFIKLDAFYCKTADCSTATGRPLEKKFKFEGSRYPEINKRISAWVNKNRTFPDYMDILNLVKKVTKNNLLPLRPEVIRVEAVNIFRDVGKILKERREKDDTFCIYAYADDNLEMDPADMDSDLCQKLDDNEKDAKKKLDELFQFYVEKEARKEEDGKGREKDEGEKKTENEEEEEDEQSVIETDSKNGEGSDSEVELDNDSEEEEEEEEEGSQISDDVLECVDEEAPSRVIVESTENGVNFDDDSDDDIQEIKEILTTDVHYNNQYEEDEDFDSRYENDVEIADSPVSLVPNEEDKFDTSEIEPFEANYFKRKIPSFITSPLSPKRRKREEEDPEIVELDDD